MSALLAALVGVALLTQPSADAAMQTLLKAAVTLRTAAPSPSIVTPALLASIDSIGFDTGAGFGVGGFITTEIVPVVVFRNGDGLTDVRGLTAPGGLAAHKAAQPGAWTRWQRAGGELQIARAQGFATLPFQVTYATLPAGFALRGMYRRLGGAGARSEAGGTSTVARGTSTGQRGTYRVDGLVLRFTWDDGTTAQHILITDPDDPKGAIWIDGQGYARRGE